MTLELPAPLQRMLECANATVSASVDVLISVGGIEEWIERDLLEVDDRGIPIVSQDELKWFAPKLRVLRDAVHLAGEAFAAVEFDLYRVEGETSPTAEVIEFASNLYTTLFGYGSGLMRSLPEDDEEVTAKLALSFPYGWLRLREMRLNARETSRRIRKEIGRAAYLGQTSESEKLNELNLNSVKQHRFAAGSSSTPETAPGEFAASDAKQESVKRPKPDAFESFKLSFVMSPQSAIAAVVYNDSKKQPQVSKDIKAVTKFLQSCGLAKEKWRDTSEKPGFESWAPEMIDLGKRQDGRTARQRDQFEKND
jgi:hypothetical protein